MNGYKIIKGIESNPTIIALKLNRIKMMKEKDDNKINKNIASIFLILPSAKGLLDVLFTFLSRFISIKSFNIQPTLLIKKDPKKKMQYHLKYSKGFFGSNANANQHGQNNKEKPIGFVNRIKSK